MKPEIIINVRFFMPDENGRKVAVRGNGEFYACPLFLDNEGFDCRLLLEGRCLELGTTYEVPVKFLYPEWVLPKLSIGKEVVLWEGKNIAKGTIVSILTH